MIRLSCYTCYTCYTCYAQAGRPSAFVAEVNAYMVSSAAAMYGYNAAEGNYNINDESRTRVNALIG